jgi:SAM-dependent methyltransferase
MAIAGSIALLIIAVFFPSPVQLTTYILCGLLILSMAASLLVSYYVYDRSGLYKMDWLSYADLKPSSTLINIHAGFDETSALIQHRFKNSSLQVFDFYDPKKHTEVSIRRARAAYPPYLNTTHISTAHIPVGNSSADAVFLIFAAHEIRSETERINFFREVARTLGPDGKILLMEHLRDLSNFAAFNIGFFHFHSKSTWLNNIEQAGLITAQVKSINPFVKLFLITKA